MHELSIKGLPYMKKILILAIVLVPAALFSSQAARVETNAPQIAGMKNHAALTSHLDLPTQKLHEAAKVGNAVLIGTLLEQGALVNGCDTQGCTPLHWATSNGHLECVKQLVIKGKAQVNAQINAGHTALHIASSKADGGIVTFLLENQAQLNLRTRELKTPLMLAFESPALRGGDVCYILLNYGAHVEDLPDMVRRPIPYCVLVNSLGTLRYLLRGSCTQEEKNFALALALRYNRTDCAEVLLAHGANPDVSVHLSIPFLLSQTNGNVALTSQHKKLFHALHYACASNGERTTDLLLKAGANKEYFEYQGEILEMRRRPLTVACMRNRASLVQKLIGAGAQVNGRSGEDTTSLHVAAWYGSTECLQLLLAAHASVELQDVYGHTPLLIALYKNSIPCVELLRAHGATLDFLDTNPLCMACKSGDKEALTQAVQKLYADWKPSQEYKTEIVKIIADKGPKMTDNGLTATYYLINKGVVPSFEGDWRGTLISDLILRLECLFTVLHTTSFAFHESIADLCNPRAVKENFSEIIKAGIDERIAEIESKKDVPANGVQTSKAETEEPDPKKRKITDSEGTPHE